MRSRCRRSIITTSAPFSPSAMVFATITPMRSMPDGSSVDGATTRTCAPSALSSRMFERATRECRMSPQIATIRLRQRPLGTADGQRVEQRLRRVLMRAVAGVDHRAADLLRQQRGRSGRLVADDQNVRPHGVQRHRRVDQRLALLHRRACDRHVHHVGAEPFSGEFEGRLGAGRRLVEEVDLGAAAQRRGLLLGLARDRHGGVGAVEQHFDIGGRKIANAKQMAVRVERRRGRFGHVKALL